MMNEIYSFIQNNKIKTFFNNLPSQAIVSVVYAHIARVLMETKVKDLLSALYSEQTSRLCGLINVSQGFHCVQQRQKLSAKHMYTCLCNLVDTECFAG